MASSSSFTEGSSVFGGGNNVRTAVRNVFEIYDPDIIAILTTCLSETIGDDVKAYIQEMQIPEESSSYTPAHPATSAPISTAFPI
jgi:nitrogenase molybdenum-iron protein beta chain